MPTSADRTKKTLIKSLGSPKGENIARGAKIYYGVTSNGVKAALIVRKADHIYRGQCATLNEANANGRLGWPLDMNTLWMIRRKECSYILTFNSTNGDVWIARPDDWEDKAKLIDGDVITTNYRGHVIRHLSVEHMIKIEGAIDLKTGRR